MPAHLRQDSFIVDPVDPIRAELFSVERLEEHAASLAAAQTTSDRARWRRPLPRRLKENANILVESFREIARAAQAKNPISPAGEWLMDNFHVIEEQIREIRNDLPPDYYRELPKLDTGPLAGYPRIYGIGWALVAHTDSGFDIEKLTRFVRAYQQTTPLTIGELWALGVTMRLTLIENLRRLAESIVARSRQVALADRFVTRILAVQESGALNDIIEELSHQALSAAAISRLEQRLRDHTIHATTVLRWIDAKLTAHALSTEQVIREEYQTQGAINVTMRNIITSMRLLSDIDWTKFVESVSIVDRILAEGSNFRDLDFASRDQYRRAIEKLSRGSNLSEIDIARIVIQFAQSAARSTRPAREAEVGFYLISRGRKYLESAIEYRPNLTGRIRGAMHRSGLVGYLAAVGLITAALLALAHWLVQPLLPQTIWSTVLILLLGAIPASDLAMAMINRLVTKRLGPAPLPGLALRGGIPDHLRSIVVMPILLLNEDSIEDHLKSLEVHYLSNTDRNLRFALLSDWPDSDTAHTPHDDHLLKLAQQGIDQLNQRYGEDNFILLHRRRCWNDAQDVWMGWERKRGKLHELNRLLRGAQDTSFILRDGDTTKLGQDIRYVITLDGDTRLPRGSAIRLVGKMAHPLNRPVIDPKCNRVVEGHGILQPRVTPSLPSSSGSSLFQWAFSGPNGLDPYAFAVSDVYQDLFNEGSYVGKGIYDVDAFETVLHQRIPENTILSHDLLEGTFARAALASDIEVVEEFPSRYDVEAARQHRWMRGDWQLLPWIFGFGRDQADPEDQTIRQQSRRRTIPLLARWKMFDNLRRSLFAPATLLALLWGWTLPAPADERWTLFVLAALILPPFLPLLGALVPHRVGVSRRSHLRNLAHDFALDTMQVLFVFTFMARQAWLALDAILRTLFRLFISGKYLLEWLSFAHSHYSATSNRRAFALQLCGSFAFIAGAGYIIGTQQPANLPFVVPFLLLWALSPAIARWSSAPRRLEPHKGVTEYQALELRLIARRTWRFFEVFVTAEDNHLPPDNFQEDPRPLIAHRTSPTNIGLYFMSLLAARDFGWIGTRTMLDKLEATFATFDRLEQYRGHLLNWYQTQTLESLPPRYVSSVDSGNLAGNLIALKNACQDIMGQDIMGQDFAETDFGPAWPIITTALRDHLILCARAANRCARLNGEKYMRFADQLQKLENKLTDFSDQPKHTALHALAPDIAALLPAAQALQDNSGEVLIWAQGLQDCLQSHHADMADHPDLKSRLLRLADLSSQMVQRMEFGFLFDTQRQLLSIGYRVDDQALDGSAYDLLASEARLASLIAIAKGDIPTRNWFRLGRTMMPLRHGSVLLSWSGSMFEYLMPALLMREPAGSLLANSSTLAVRQQISYGHERGIPWGISESQYNARDREQNYQYTGFGVPQLGLKRGLSENTLVSPYSSGLAAMIAPVEALKNFQRLKRLGARGAYGFYEAIDYTRARLTEGASFAIVRSFMSHHQGMTIIGIANILHDGLMRERFHKEAMIESVELLLQERMPRDVSVARPPPEQNTGAVVMFQSAPPTQRRFTSPHSAVPRTHLLSNGHYALMLTASGSGYSRWGDIAITRWREDATRDQWGSYIYLRDTRSGTTWSAGYQPCITTPDDYEARFSEDRAQIIRNDLALTTMLDVAVSPEDDAEVRRISITNHGNRTREIDVTSFAELVLARPADDAAHPAFSKMFVTTEYVPDLHALIATRRKRSPGDADIWAAHLSVVEGQSTAEVQYETDRARFLGRRRTARNPVAIDEGWPLSNTAGTVLDPIFSLRRRVLIPRGETVTVAFWTMIGASRAAVLDLADKHRDAAAFTRATTLASTQAPAQLQYLGIGADEAHLYQALANCLIYPDPALRAPPEIRARAARPASTLWPLGISGDLPIVILRIDDDEDLEIARQMLKAHAYWQSKKLAVDLVILNDHVASYAQDLQTGLEALLRDRNSPSLGNIYLLRNDLLNAGMREVLLSAARLSLSNRRGTLIEQIARVVDLSGERDARLAPLDKTPATRKRPAVIGKADPAHLADLPKLDFANSYGGFSQNGRDYVTVMQNGEVPPQPWVNVIANEKFGFMVSTTGAGFTWSANSQQNQITAWSNDPVSDECSEALYLRDLDTDQLWSPTLTPAGASSGDGQSRHICWHGQGYSRFEHHQHGLTSTMLQFVPRHDPVKITRLTLINRTSRPRRLSLTAYVEWALGTTRAKAAPYIVTEIDPATGAFFAQNPWNEDFGRCVSFLDMGGLQTSWTGDRCEFIGRHGALDQPAALLDDLPLSRRTGPGLDPCAVLQSEIRIAPGAQVDIVLTLGQGETRSEAQELVSRYRTANIDKLFKDITQFWDDTLSVIQVRTPDRAMDLLLNRWLLYQTLACRVFARAGFYQASGAYGFRDQLQDSMALCLTTPQTARAHILRAAGRQFVEGDVQHWWLPESGKGVRTKFSDDRVWLSYVAAHYIKVTGDMAVLEEDIPFLDGPLLKPGEHEVFFQPTQSSERASLYEHCARALDQSLAVGRHGLPLMGSGDWNDGMNRVGEGGRGESVWLGWFLVDTLNKFIPLAEARNDGKRAAAWLLHVTVLKEALEDTGWDGDWYRRAYYDDGTPLGSVANAECRIDSIAQAWSVISGAGRPQHAARAMQAVDKYLVRRADRLMRLFTPPFVNSNHDPGYIKGYPAGLRENGGQYTHGVLWSVAAFAMLGDGDRAGELFAMINPINHARDRVSAERYRTEPYALCGDVYSVAPHTGRGGWSWYTGGAGWMYRVGTEWILGLHIEGAHLRIDPCIPRHWPGFSASITYQGRRYEITVDNPDHISRGIVGVTVDGKTFPSACIPLSPAADMSNLSGADLSAAAQADPIQIHIRMGQAALAPSVTSEKAVS